MNKYIIKRNKGGTVTCTVEEAIKYKSNRDNRITASRSYPLKHVVYHSPDGFEFGYGGSGPADLALSILADHFNESPTGVSKITGHHLLGSNFKCWEYHQDFKWRFIMPLDKIFGGTITSEHIDKWLEEYEKDK